MEPAVVIVLVVLAVSVLATLGLAIFLLVKLIRLGKLIRSDLMPPQGRIAFWSALLYTVFPLDLLPDPIYLDDIGVLAAAAAYVQKLAHAHGIVGGGGGATRMPRRLSSTRRI